MTETFVVAALYKFARVQDPDGLRAALEAVCRDNNICGTLLLAYEGINGTVAGSRAGIDALISFIRAQRGLDGLEYKESSAETQRFLTRSRHAPPTRR